jgi:hypothetical protein
MRTVDILTPADRGTVWRCSAFTVAWIEDSKTVATRTGTTTVAAWCRLDFHQWIPLDPMPAGPFHELGTMAQLNFSDYRYQGFANYHSNVRP